MMINKNDPTDRHRLVFAHGTDQIFCQWYWDTCKRSMRKRNLAHLYMIRALLHFERQFERGEDFFFDLPADKTASGKVERWVPEDQDEDFDSEFVRDDDE